VSLGPHVVYRDLVSKSLTTLELLPLTPPIPAGDETVGVELNLSDNYLTANSLHHASFVTNLEWRTPLMKLELQENNISSLCWMADRAFPNLQMLNISNNWLTEVQEIPYSCPEIKHLILCGNPLPREISVLTPLKLLRHLTTLGDTNVWIFLFHCNVMRYCIYHSMGFDNSFSSLDFTGAPVTSHEDYANYISKHLSCVKVIK